MGLKRPRSPANAASLTCRGGSKAFHRVGNTLCSASALASAPTIGTTSGRANHRKLASRSRAVRPSCSSHRDSPCRAPSGPAPLASGLLASVTSGGQSVSLRCMGPQLARHGHGGRQPERVRCLGKTGCGRDHRHRVTNPRILRQKLD